MAGIIFDMDGTLANSFDYVVDFLVKEKRIKDFNSAQKDELRDLSMVAMAKKLGFHWWDGPRLIIKGRRRMNASINDLGAFKGMHEIVRKVHEEGHELFILSSNSVKNIQQFIKKEGLEEYFLEIYGGVGLFSKSSSLKRLINDQNIEITNSVYVGDELRDVEAAQSIGMRIIAVTWGFASKNELESANPTGLADTTQELMQILEEI